MDGTLRVQSSIPWPYVLQAWACSRSLNRLLRYFKKDPCFGYLVAGGDKVLIVGDELPEDDPPRGGCGLEVEVATMTALEERQRGLSFPSPQVPRI